MLFHLTSIRFTYGLLRFIFSASTTKNGKKTSTTNPRKRKRAPVESEDSDSSDEVPKNDSKSQHKRPQAPRSKDSEDEGDKSHESSDSGDSDDSETDTTPIHFTFERKFKSKEEMDSFLRGEECWSVRSTQNLNKGVKTTYRCNLVKCKGEQCAAQVYTLHDNPLSSDSEDASDDEYAKGQANVIYSLYRNNKQHTHDKLKNRSAKVSDVIKEKIIQMHQNNVFPKGISYRLMSDDTVPDDQVPSKRQIKNIIEQFKANNESVSKNRPITMKDLCDFAEAHSNIPADEDAAFVAAFERSPPNESEKRFHLFLTTPRLLRNAKDAKNLHADATHKVTTESLPLIAVGSTDMAQSFHLTGLVITSHENTSAYEFAFKAMKDGIERITTKVIQPSALVADADAAIHKGFANVFGTQHSTVVMCVTHVFRNVQTKYKFNDRANKPLLMDDLRKLRQAVSERKFKVGCKLFAKKWSKKEKEVVALIQKSWFDKNSNWYNTCKFRTPKTNNANESFNGHMKKHQTLYKKTPLKQFLIMALRIVHQRSKEYKKEKAVFQKEVPIPNALMAKGKKFDKSYFEVANTDGSQDCYVFAGDTDRDATQDDIEEFETAKYRTWDDFEENAFSMWKVSFPKGFNKWKKATCTCPQFNDDFMCKHVIGIAHQNGEVDDICYEDRDNEPLFKSKRGRPTKPTPALQRE